MTRREILSRLERIWGRVPRWLLEVPQPVFERYLTAQGWVLGGARLVARASSDRIAIAEELLSEYFGDEVLLSTMEVPGPGTGRSSLFRMRASADDERVPETVVLRYANTDAEHPWSPDAGGRSEALFNEWAGLDLLSRLPTSRPIAPRLYGGDRGEGVLVMEDLGKGASPYDALFGDDPAHAAEMLVGWMRTLGRMHVSTIGHAQAFDRTRSGLGPVEPRLAREDQSRRLVENLRGTCELVGVEPRHGCEKEIEAIAGLLADPGESCALSQGDPTPDDCLEVGEELRLVDFEFAEYRHPLLDATSLRMLLPTCWRREYRVPGSVVRSAEAAYRDEVAKACPFAADDDAFARAFVVATACWVLRGKNQTSPWFVSKLLAMDRPWGARRRVVERLGALAETTEEFGHLTAIGATARDLETRLRRRWRDSEKLEYYPAFQTTKARARSLR